MTLPKKSDGDVINDFISAMAAAGLSTSARIIGDGELQRFHVDGDATKSLNGWYVLFLDTDNTFKYPAGEFGCWKRGIQSNWCARNEAELTPVELDTIRRRIEASRAERAERARQRQEAAASEAVRIWNASIDADQGEQHAYLTRKSVRSYGLRVGKWPSGAEALLVPVNDASGRMVSLQAIFANVNPNIGRDKDFLAGGKKRGCWFSIGMPPPAGNGVIVLCEGYATGATIHDATGFYVCVAFDSGNLKSVAFELRRRWPGCTIVIAADNDRWTIPTDKNPHIVENPGVTFARQIVDQLPLRIFVAVPEFRNLDAKPTDFNDLAQLDGMDAVRQQINAALPEFPAPANDNEPTEKPLLPMDGVLAAYGFVHVSEKGQPLNTVENLDYLLTQYGIKARYNETHKTVEIDIPGRTYTIDNKDNCGLAELTSLCARNRMPQSMLSDYVKLIADKNAYNPVRDWIKSKKWDGKKRLQSLFDTVKVAGDTTMRDMLLYRWMLSAVAAIFTPRGFESHGVLVFTGQQGIGKTKWVKRLVPANLDVVLAGAIIDPSNKDTITNAVAHWIVEMGELDATFRKADVARLKAFVTLSVDKLRRPYDRIESVYQRRTVFFASVNTGKYLVDDTGNRRWWTIAATEVDYMHTLDTQQIWAEILAHFERGERWHLTADEQIALEKLNTEHQEIDPIDERISTSFDWQSGNIGFGLEEMTATDVLIAIGLDKPTKSQCGKASDVLRRLTGGEPVRRSNGRFFKIPKRIKSNLRGDNFDDDGPI